MKSFLKHRFGDLAPRDSDAVELGWGLRLCIHNKLPGDAAAAGPGAIL